MTESKLVEIVVPTYNSGSTLLKTVDCILNQTYPNWKLFIINDGSTDNTPELLEKYKFEPRITVAYQENGGISSARNAGLRLCSGTDYIAYCDADDWWEPFHLEASVSTLSSGATFAYCHPKAVVGSDGKQLWPNFPLYSRFDAAYLKQGNIIYIPSVVHQGKIGFFDPELDGLEDYDLWIRAYLQGYIFKQHDSKSWTHLKTSSGFAKFGSSKAPLLHKKYPEFFADRGVYDGTYRYKW